VNTTEVQLVTETDHVLLPQGWPNSWLYKCDLDMTMKDFPSYSLQREGYANSKIKTLCFSLSCPITVVRNFILK